MRFINGHEKYCTLKIKNDRNEERGGGEGERVK